jgi:thymidylate synthase
MRGSDRLDEISFYADRWREMSDDGQRIRGSSYGAKIFCPKGLDGQGQWQTVERLLRLDPESRRAVLHFSDPSEKSILESRDVSCATSLQFSVRNQRLEAIAVMRSNDIMLGLPYDIFLFTMLQEYMATALGLELGPYSHFVGSMHIYEHDYPKAREIIVSAPQISASMPPMTSCANIQRLLDGEIASRCGNPGSVNASDDEEYWSELLSVLVYRNERRAHVATTPEMAIRNPVLRALAKLSAQSS